MDEFINGIHNATTTHEIGAISSGSSVLSNKETVWLNKELDAVMKNINQSLI